MYIAGPYNELTKLRKLIFKWISKNYAKNDFDKLWLGNIVIGAKFSIDDFECRGDVLYVGENRR